MLGRHVVAVAVAHRHLGGGTQLTARAAHPERQWMAAMVIYTMVSLWLLAQPLTQDKTTPPPATPAAVTTSAAGSPMRSP